MRSSLNAAARWRPMLFGAAAGLLAAIALNLAGVPLIKGDHSIAILVAATILGALVGLFALWTLAGWITVAIAAVTAVIIATPITGALSRSVIRRDPVPPEPLAAVVVLSSSVNSDGFLDLQALERLLSALQVTHANHPRMLITTHIAGGMQGGQRITSDADQRSLIALAGDTAIWRVTALVHNTHDEALETAKIVAPSAGPIGVVTSPMHTRRACAVFEGVGFKVVCIPSDSRDNPVDHLGGIGPRFHAFVGWLYERLAWMEYRSRGWIKA